MESLVVFKDITKKFQLFWEEITILEKTILNINRDELVLLYGPSGSGKTTVLNLLVGLLTPDEGEIQVAGLFLDIIPEREKADFRAKYFGIVFQEFNLVSTLTVKENIILFQELCGLEIDDDEKKIDGLLEKLGIDHRADSFPSQISGGEKKRVAIARALTNDPFILILDEPTGNLDRETANQICALIEELFQTTDMSVIVASHDPKMKDIASTIYRVEGGNIELETEFSERRKKKTVKYRPLESLERLKEELDALEIGNDRNTEESEIDKFIESEIDEFILLESNIEDINMKNEDSE